MARYTVGSHEPGHRIMNGFARVDIREKIRQTNLKNAREVRQVFVFDTMALALDLCDYLPRYIQTF